MYDAVMSNAASTPHNVGKVCTGTGYLKMAFEEALFCDCECGYLGGPYVPMCPFRPYGVTGLARGDMCKRLRAAWDGRGGWEWDEPPEDLSPPWYAKRRVNE